MSKNRVVGRRRFLSATALGTAGLALRPGQAAPACLDLGSGGTLVVVSDVHIGAAPAGNVECLAEMLDVWRRGRCHVVFAGDLLDLWCAEDDAAWAALQPVLPGIRALARDGLLWLIPGNHDFRLRDEVSPPSVPESGPLRAFWDTYEKRCATLFLPSLGLTDRSRVLHRHLVVRSNGVHFVITHGDETDFGQIAKELLPRNWFGLLAWVYRGVDMLPATVCSTIERAWSAANALFKQLTPKLIAFALTQRNVPRDAWGDLPPDAFAWDSLQTVLDQPEQPPAERRNPMEPVTAEEAAVSGLLDAILPVLEAPKDEAEAVWEQVSTRGAAWEAEGLNTERWLVTGAAPLSEVRGRLTAPQPSIDLPKEALECSLAAYRADRPDMFDYVVMGHRHHCEPWPRSPASPHVWDVGSWRMGTPANCNYGVIRNGRLELKTPSSF
jgi:hypothetical protein